MQNGWVKLHKKVIYNEVWINDPTAWRVFECLLCICKSENGVWEGGRFTLSEYCRIKPSTLYKALKRLESLQMIELLGNNKYTTISICKWSDFQQVSNNKVTTKGQQSNNKVTTKGQQSNTIKRNKEIKKYIDKSIYGKPEINEMFDFWDEATNMPIKSQVQKNRNACQTLLNQHTKEGLEKLISGVSMSHSDQYAPKITNFIELLALQNKLMLWGRQKTQGKVVKV